MKDNRALGEIFEVSKTEILNLIHDHPVEFWWLVKSKNYFDYSILGGTTVDFRFSEKEYNLLKEWLKNGKEAL